MVVAGHTSTLQWGTAFLSGGGLTAIIGWAASQRKTRRQHQRVWDVIVGVPASPGVPAVPSLVDRLEAVAARLDGHGDRIGTLEEKSGDFRRELAGWSAGQVKWEEAFDRKLARVGAQVRRLQGQASGGQA